MPYLLSNQLFFVIRFDGILFLLIRSKGHADRGYGNGESRDGYDHNEGAFVEYGADNGGACEFSEIFVGEGRITEIARGKGNVRVFICEIERSGIFSAAINHIVVIGMVVIEGAVFESIRATGSVNAALAMIDECNVGVIVRDRAIAHREAYFRRVEQTIHLVAGEGAIFKVNITV